MKDTGIRRILGLLTLVLAAALLGGCAERTHADKTLVEWSRGKRVGFTSASEPVAMAVAPHGVRIALAWPVSPERGVEALQLVVLDDQGTFLTDLELPLAVHEPTTLRLAWSEADRLHLTWIEKDGETPGVRHALLDLEGNPASPPWTLSSPDMRVNGQDIALLPSGDLLVVWSNRKGLVAARIAADATLLGAASLDAPDSFALDLQAGADGTIHIAWQQRTAAAERQLSYTTLSTPDLDFSEPWNLGAVNLKSGTSVGGSATELSGPSLTLDPEKVIVGWSVGEVRGSNDSAFFVRLPESEGQEAVQKHGAAVQPAIISLPQTYQPAYTPASGPLPYQQLAASLPPGEEARRAHLRSAPALTTGVGGETPIGASIWVRTAWSAQLQPAVAILDEDAVKGFQVAGWSRYPSLHPNLAAGQEHDIYLTWIDAAGKNLPVYLASTAPSFQAAVDEVTGRDLRIAMERLLGRMVSALGLVLFALSWLVLPGFCLIFALFVVREDSLDTAQGMALLFFMIGAHWAGKYLFSPDVLANLPRMSDLPLIFPLGTLLFPTTWAYLPNQLQLPALIAPAMPYLVPSLTLLAGAIATRLGYLNRAKYPSLVPAYAILAAVDLFLSLQIYALAHYDPISF